jgi:hypothetical protein
VGPTTAYRAHRRPPHPPLYNPALHSPPPPPPPSGPPTPTSIPPLPPPPRPPSPSPPPSPHPYPQPVHLPLPHPRLPPPVPSPLQPHPPFHPTHSLPSTPPPPPRPQSPPPSRVPLSPLPPYPTLTLRHPPPPLNTLRTPSPLLRRLPPLLTVAHLTPHPSRPPPLSTTPSPATHAPTPRNPPPTPPPPSITAGRCPRTAHAPSLSSIRRIHAVLSFPPSVVCPKRDAIGGAVPSRSARPGARSTSRPDNPLRRCRAKASDRLNPRRLQRTLRDGDRRLFLRSARGGRAHGRVRAWVENVGGSRWSVPSRRSSWVSCR